MSAPERTCTRRGQGIRDEGMGPDICLTCTTILLDEYKRNLRQAEVEEVLRAILEAPEAGRDP